MNFVLSEEHTMARTLFRTFAENEVKPLAQELDEQERFPTETVEKMGGYSCLCNLRGGIKQSLRNHRRDRIRPYLSLRGSNP